MNIKITQCPDPGMWYASRVGEVIEVRAADQDGYWTRDNEGYRNIIKFSDAEVVEE